VVAQSLSAFFGGDALSLRGNWKRAFPWICRESEHLRGSIGRKRFPSRQCGWERLTPGAGQLSLPLPKDAFTEVRVFDQPMEKMTKRLPLPHGSGLFVRCVETPELFYSFASYNAGETIYRLRLAKNEQNVWAQK